MVSVCYRRKHSVLHLQDWTNFILWCVFFGCTILLMRLSGNEKNGHAKPKCDSDWETSGNTAFCFLKVLTATSTCHCQTVTTCLQYINNTLHTINNRTYFYSPGYNSTITNHYFLTFTLICVLKVIEAIVENQ